MIILENSGTGYACATNAKTKLAATSRILYNYYFTTVCTTTTTFTTATTLLLWGDVTAEEARGQVLR